MIRLAGQSPIIDNGLNLLIFVGDAPERQCMPVCYVAKFILKTGVFELYRHPDVLRSPALDGSNGLYDFSNAAWLRASEMSYDSQIARVSALAFSVLKQPGASYA